MPSRPVPFAALVSTCAALVALAALLTLLHAAITADGAYYLVRILETGTVFGPEARVLANAIRQAPVLLADALGVTDLRSLSFVHGVGQIVLPAGVWTLAIVLTRRDRLVFVAVATTAALCAGSTWLFAVSENVLAVPLTVLVAVLLWRPTWRAYDAALAVAGSLVLVASYETALLTGLVLGVWALLRARAARAPVDTIGSALVAIASALSVVAAIVGASGVGPGPRHAQSFLYYVISLEPWPIYVAIAGLALVVAGFELPLGETAHRAMLAAGLGFVAVGVAFTDTTIAAAYQARGAASSASLALMGYLLWRAWRRDRRGVDTPRASPSSWLVYLPLAASLGTLVVVVGAARGWVDDLEAFRDEVVAREGVVVADDVLPPDNDGLWGWTALYLSLVVRDAPSDAILVDRDPSYAPFTPDEARRRLDDAFVWMR